MEAAWKFLALACVRWSDADLARAEKMGKSHPEQEGAWEFLYPAVYAEIAKRAAIKEAA
jgi:hypothetical protein